MAQQIVADANLREQMFPGVPDTNIAAAIAAIHVTLRERIWEQAAAKGNYIIPKLKEEAESS